MLAQPFLLSPPLILHVLKAFRHVLKAFRATEHRAQCNTQHVEEKVLDGMTGLARVGHLLEYLENQHAPSLSRTRSRPHFSCVCPVITPDLMRLPWGFPVGRIVQILTRWAARY